MKQSLYFIMAIFFMTQTLTAEAIDEVTFSGGAPLDGYQPRIIVPILERRLNATESGFMPNITPASAPWHLQIQDKWTENFTGFMIFTWSAVANIRI